MNKTILKLSEIDFHTPPPKKILDCPLTNYFLESSIFRKPLKNSNVLPEKLRKKIGHTDIIGEKGKY